MAAGCGAGKFLALCLTVSVHFLVSPDLFVVGGEERGVYVIGCVCWKCVRGGGQLCNERVCRINSDCKKWAKRGRKKGREKEEESVCVCVCVYKISFLTKKEIFSLEPNVNRLVFVKSEKSETNASELSTLS